MLKNKNFLVKNLVNISIILIGVFFLVSSFSVSPGFQQVVGADQYPRWFAIILIALAIASIIKDIFNYKRGKFTEELPLIKEMRQVGPRILTLFGLLILNVFLIPYIGYFEAGFVFLALAIFALGERNIKGFLAALGYSALITLAIYIVFSQIMNIYLPPGIIL